MSFHLKKTTSSEMKKFNVMYIAMKNSNDNVKSDKYFEFCEYPIERVCDKICTK